MRLASSNKDSYYKKYVPKVPNKSIRPEFYQIFDCDLFIISNLATKQQLVTVLLNMVPT